MDKSKQHPIFLKELLSLLFCLALSITVIVRANKLKSDFIHVKGKIIYLEKKLPNRDIQKKAKERYLQIDQSAKIFKIFVGKDWGDFKPQFEMIDSLQLGDSIDIYYDENFKTKTEQINSLVQYIDKNEKTYFVRGPEDKILGPFLLVFCLILILVLYFLKRTGTID